MQEIWKDVVGYVLKIRELSKKYTKIELARMFGIGRRSINNIVNRKSWKHI